MPVNQIARSSTCSMLHTFAYVPHRALFRWPAYEYTSNISPCVSPFSLDVNGVLLIAGVCVDNEPELPRAYGSQGRSNLPGISVHSGSLRPHWIRHRSSQIPVKAWQKFRATITNQFVDLLVYSEKTLQALTLLDFWITSSKKPYLITTQTKQEEKRAQHLRALVTS